MTNLYAYKTMNNQVMVYKNKDFTGYIFTRDNEMQEYKNRWSENKTKKIMYSCQAYKLIWITEKPATL